MAVGAGQRDRSSHPRDGLCDRSCDSGRDDHRAPNGERSRAQLGVGKSYFRKAGVQHDVLNETTTEIVFLEVELKP
jgi:hypothetical protein